MKPIFLSVIISVLIAVPQFASAKDSAAEIELDPIAYAMSGYSFHIGEYMGSWKFDINTAAESFSQ